MTRPKFAPKHAAPTPAMIKAARLAAGLSMPAAAKLCEVSTASWETWEYGRGKMPAPIWKLFNLLTQKDAN